MIGPASNPIHTPDDRDPRDAHLYPKDVFTPLPTNVEQAMVRVLRARLFPPHDCPTREQWQRTSVAELKHRQALVAALRGEGSGGRRES